jgi:alanyl-tRNA synthetase
LPEEPAPKKRAALRPYHKDSYTTSFSSRVAASREDERGHWVALENSYFYPEGGGQESDRGTISGIEVLDVQEDGEGRVWHLVAGETPVEVTAEIDTDRRAGHRRQHTGQHILSQAFERVLGAVTVSARLGETVGSIDLDRPSLTWDEVTEVEEAANRVIWENRPVASHLVDASGLERFQLRRPPKVEGEIRLIEVEDWDVSPCGGTHCSSSGEIGLIKVKRWENFRGGSRVEFICGERALADYQVRLRQMSEAALRRDTADEKIIETLDRATDERDRLRKRYKKLALKTAELEAGELAAAHRQKGEAVFSLVLEESDTDSLRALGLGLTSKGVARVVLACRKPEPRVLVTRPRGKGEGCFDLSQLLPLLLEVSRGKGGGGPDLLQASAAGSELAEAAVRAVTEEWQKRL